ncbi:MAG: outer membrane protein transport protein [Bacteroidetes bacterium]|nr:outer membrane protein transport protein [Bacteroidota bacterium]
MKKFTLLTIGIILSTSFLMAGGLVHNTNQSAAWSRMLSRGASVEIDAVYFNPAGLTKLGDGFHISLSSQSIFQTQTITSTFPTLNEEKYTGTISAPVFPSVYLAYKTGKFVFSFGFLAIGGGGGAAFDKGVPMMEVPIAALVPTFGQMGVTGYSVDMEFNGTSVYWGLQAGVSYEINDHVSVFAGARYIMAKNTYKGHIKDIELKFGDDPANDLRADKFMGDNGTALGNIATAMDQLVDSPLGALTFDQAIAATAGDPATQALLIGLKGGLEQLGHTGAGDFTVTQGQGVYRATSNQFFAGAVLMGDQEGDITQTGNGITPIIGANLSFFEDQLNIGLKYEFKTKMDLTNKVDPNRGFAIGMNPDGTPIYMFPDGAKTNADIPAMASIGVDYRIIEPLKVSVTYHTYFDKNTGWAKEAEDATPSAPVIDKNFWEFAIGLEYSITDDFLLSGGYLRAQTGVTQAYQSNLGFSLTTNTMAFGGAYKINDMFRLNLGGYYTMYDEQTYNMNYVLMDGSTSIPYKETYLKSTFAVAIGVDIAIGAKK